MTKTASDEGIPATRAAKRPNPLPGLSNLQPYVQGKSEINGQRALIKLSSNESCLGTSPAAVAAFKDAAVELHRYPDGSQSQLRHAIAEKYDLDANGVVCGNGSEELIGLLTNCFVGAGDELVLPENHFVMCSIYAKAQDARVVLAPERGRHIDVDAMLAAITSRTRMLAVANPNNPTGTYVSADDIRRLVDGCPKDVIVLLDGAYAEYVEEPDYDSGLSWVRQSPNVVVTRTFSKIYGLAGLRIGWMYGPAHIVEIVNRLRTPFNANSAAMAAAVAALGDDEFVARARRHNNAWLQRIGDELIAMGLRVVPSVANFYLVEFPSGGEKNAAGASACLEADGIIARPAGSEGDLRITVGTDSENVAVLDTLKRYMQAQ